MRSVGNETRSLTAPTRADMLEHLPSGRAARASTTRRRLVRTTALLPAAVATACRGDGGRTGAGVARTAPPQHVRIASSMPDTQFDFESSWTDFLAEHPGWTKEIAYNVGNVKFIADIAAGDAPDTFTQNSSQLLDTAAKGLVRPLEPYLARDRFDWKRYYPAAKIGAEYRQQHYGTPHHVDVYSLYANEPVLREGGVDPKKQPASWDELVATNRRLLKHGADGQPTRLGFVPVYGVSPFPLWYFPANGAPLVSPDGTKVGFDTAAGLEVLEWMASAVGALGGWSQLQAFRAPFQARAAARTASGTPSPATPWRTPSSAPGASARACSRRTRAPRSGSGRCPAGRAPGARSSATTSRCTWCFPRSPRTPTPAGSGSCATVATGPEVHPVEHGRLRHGRHPRCGERSGVAQGPALAQAGQRADGRGQAPSYFPIPARTRSAPPSPPSSSPSCAAKRAPRRRWRISSARPSARWISSAPRERVGGAADGLRAGSRSGGRVGDRYAIVT